VTTGERDIEPDEARIVERILRDFIAGVSPKQIAKNLNREGIAGPFGGAWSPSTIYGNAKRGSGILNNELCLGRLVWNRLRYVKNPDTGKRVSRLNPASEWTRTEVPQLRIVSDELWDAAKHRQENGRKGIRSVGNPVGARRPQYLFSGLTKRGVCGAGFIMTGKHSLGCFGARDQGRCDNHQTIRRDEIEARVLKALQEKLLNQELFEEFRDEFTREMNRLRMERRASLSSAKRDVERIGTRIKKLLNLMLDDEIAVDEGKAEIKTLDARRQELQAQLETADEPPPLLHPEMAELYRQKVTTLAQALEHPETRTESTEALRALIDAIVLTPAENGLRIELKGNLAAMLGATVQNKRAQETEALSLQESMVAGARYHHCRPPSTSLRSDL